MQPKSTSTPTTSGEKVSCSSTSPCGPCLSTYLATRECRCCPKAQNSMLRHQRLKIRRRLLPTHVAYRHTLPRSFIAPQTGPCYLPSAQYPQTCTHTQVAPRYPVMSCRVLVRPRAYSPVGALLVQDAVTALAAADGLATLEGHVLVAVAALVVHGARVRVDGRRLLRGARLRSAVVVLARHCGLRGLRMRWEKRRGRLRACVRGGGGCAGVRSSCGWESEVGGSSRCE
jgi:hypothetical protein